MPAASHARRLPVGFEIVVPCSRPSAIENGEVALSVSKTIRITAGDLINRVKVTPGSHEVCLLIDTGTRRIAVRKARPGEPSIKPRLNKARTVAEIPVA